MLGRAVGIRFEALPWSPDDASRSRVVEALIRILIQPNARATVLLAVLAILLVRAPDDHIHGFDG